MVRLSETFRGFNSWPLYTPLKNPRRFVRLSARRWTFDSALRFCRETGKRGEAGLYQSLGKRAADLAWATGDLRGARRLMRQNARKGY